MRKLLTLLLLLVVAPVFGQELTPTYVNTGNLIETTYPTTYGFTDGVAPFEQVGLGGVVYDPNDWNGDGSYYQFSYMPGAIIATIDLTSLNVNSLSVFLTSFAFKTDCNNSIGGSCTNPLGPQDWVRSRMELFNADGLFGSYNMFNTGDGTYYSYTGDQWVGAFNYVNKDMVNLTSLTSNFTYARLIIEGQDTGYWGGLYGPKIDSLNLQIEYDSALQGLAPPAVDCQTDPLNPDCAVLVYTDPNLIADSVIDTAVASAADAATQDSSTTDEVVVEEDEEVTVAEELTPADLEEKLKDDDEEVVVAESSEEQTSTIIYVSRELTDEEKAAILADAISKNTLEGALAIAGTAAISGSSAGTTETSNTGTVKKDTSGLDMSVDSSGMVATDNMQSSQAETQDGSFALDILEIGRVKGQEALAATMAATENSANDSINQAESVAATSAASSYANNNDDSLMVGGGAISSTGEVTTAAEMAAAESVAQAEAIALASIESSKQASQSAFDDGTNTDAELVTAIVDPALSAANAYNGVPNMMNLEILGVIKAPVEEKSDAEKRAAEVVAANQQQMEEINKNYMEADQSGIVAAMGADTDVGTYRTAMIADAAQWYKDKDIYKGVVIKDNVRSSYFLEKGNSDLYKQLIGEQYK